MKTQTLENIKLNWAAICSEEIKIFTKGKKLFEPLRFNNHFIYPKMVTVSYAKVKNDMRIEEAELKSVWEDGKEFDYEEWEAKVKSKIRQYQNLENKVLPLLELKYEQTEIESYLNKKCYFV